MNRTQSIIIAALIVACALVLGGCKSGTTSISSILKSPDSYLNKEVTVAGHVTKTYEVNLLITEAGAYQVDDGTGKIWVITKTGVPSQGQAVGLKGKVSGGVKIGRESVGAVIRETDRRTK